MNDLSSHLADLARSLAAEQQWYDDVRKLWRDSLGDNWPEEKKHKVNKWLLHGSTIRQERASELRELADDTPQHIKTELFRLAMTLETSADPIQEAICELAAMPPAPPAAEQEEPPAADHMTKWALMSHLNWPKHLKTAIQRTRFLDDHKSDIPNESKGRRRYVDANAFHRFWSKKNLKAFESLDGDKEGKPVVPESVSTSQYLENVVPLYQQVFKGKHPRE